MRLQDLTPVVVACVAVAWAHAEGAAGRVVQALGERTKATHASCRHDPLGPDKPPKVETIGAVTAVGYTCDEVFEALPPLLDQMAADPDIDLSHGMFSMAVRTGIVPCDATPRPGPPARLSSLLCFDVAPSKGGRR